MADTRVNVTGRRNELRLRRLNLGSNAKEYAMITLTTGIVAAATLLSAAPAFAIDIDVGPDGIRVGPDIGSMMSGISAIDPIIATELTAGK